MGNTTQKRQIAILSAVAMLSIIMITGITTSTLFDQKADALKSKFKKFTSKTGANGANGANGGVSSSGGSGSNGASGGSGSITTNGASGGSGTSGGG